MAVLFSVDANTWMGCKHIVLYARPVFGVCLPNFRDFLRHALRADLVSPFSAQRSSVGLLAALGTAGIG